MDDELLEAPISSRLTQKQLDSLLSNAKAMGSTKDIVLRELIRAFNSYCENGTRRPTFPFQIYSPGYSVEEGKVVDNTPSIMTGLGVDAEQHNRENAAIYGPGKPRQKKAGGALAETEAAQQVKRNARKSGGGAKPGSGATAHPSSSQKPA